MTCSVFPPARYMAPLCHQRWPSEEILPTITDIPVLFLAGGKDEIVPYVLGAYHNDPPRTNVIFRPSHMRDLFSLCRAKKKFFKLLENGDHNSSVAEPHYFDYLADFINTEVLGS